MYCTSFVALIGIAVEVELEVEIEVKGRTSLQELQMLRNMEPRVSKQATQLFSAHHGTLYPRLNLFAATACQISHSICQLPERGIVSASAPQNPDLLHQTSVAAL
jgi:hypothetical protein